MSGQPEREPLPPREALVVRWEALMGRPPPSGFSAMRLHRGIRYAEQVAADPELTRLDREVNRRLKQLARQPNRKKPPLPAGTRLLREWRGTTHEVLVTDEGFVHRGTTYRSLTAAAFAITGTKWSGYEFFGLK